MTMRAAALLSIVLLGNVFPLFAQEKETTVSRTITLQEAVQLALKHNHIVRIQRFKVEEKEHAKDAAKSTYFPILKNESTAVKITESEHIEIPAGALGVGATPIPTQNIILGQGGLAFQTSGTSLTQPLTPLFKFREINNLAAAELGATRAEARQTENEVALKVRQLYFRILVAESRRAFVEAGIAASEALQKERAEQLKFGASLEQETIESRAQTLQAKQELLTTDFAIYDLTMQLNDAVGLPLGTTLTLDHAIPERGELCAIEECKQLAVKAHPEIDQAQQQVERASAAVRLAKRDYIPDTAVFARHSYQSGVPFLEHNFGTFGFALTYEIFDGGRKRATLAEHRSQLSQATENLERIKEEVELHVQTAYNKLERTREMVRVSEELVALRIESRRVTAEQLKQGAALNSQAATALAHELEAKAALLQSQLDYVQARDELTFATGQTPPG